MGLKSERKPRPRRAVNPTERVAHISQTHHDFCLVHPVSGIPRPVTTFSIRQPLTDPRSRFPSKFHCQSSISWKSFPRTDPARLQHLINPQWDHRHNQLAPNQRPRQSGKWSVVIRKRGVSRTSRRKRSIVSVADQLPIGTYSSRQTLIMAHTDENWLCRRKSAQTPR